MRLVSVAGKSPESVRGRANALAQNRASAEFFAGHSWLADGSTSGRGWPHVRTWEASRPDVRASAQFFLWLVVSA